MSWVFKSKLWYESANHSRNWASNVSKATKWLKTEILCTFLCNNLADNEEIYTIWAEEHLILGGRNLCPSLTDTLVHTGINTANYTTFIYIFRFSFSNFYWDLIFILVGAQDLLKQKDSVSHSGFLRKRGKLERLVGSNGLFTAIFSELSKCMSGYLIFYDFIIFHFDMFPNVVFIQLLPFLKMIFNVLSLFIWQGDSVLWLLEGDVCMCTQTSMAGHHYSQCHLKTIPGKKSISFFYT